MAQPGRARHGAGRKRGLRRGRKPAGEWVGL
jgi:hypothetical protein